MKPLDAVILEINGMICILPGAFLKTNEPDVFETNYRTLCEYNDFEPTSSELGYFDGKE